MLREGELETYLKFIGKINKHNSARLLLTSSCVQANSGDHIHATTLDEIVICSKLEYLDCAIDRWLWYSKLAGQRLHNTSTCK
jgi:hypothetical protein